MILLMFSLSCKHEVSEIDFLKQNNISDIITITIQRIMILIEISLELLTLKPLILSINLVYQSIFIKSIRYPM